MADPAEILDIAYRRALVRPNHSFVTNSEIRDRVKFVARNVQNRAGVRLLLAALLAKVHRPEIDIRKPYTAIGGDDTYSGRHYDEAYVEPFIFKYALPCNPTTAFLTPALRNRNVVLTPDINLVDRPPRLYQTVLHLLADVHEGRATPRDLLSETIRWLLVVNNEQEQRMNTLLNSLKSSESEETLPLSSEDIIMLIQQHLASRNASRLPVLVVAAAYKIAGTYMGERVLPLESHTSADEQTGALGDVQITLVDDENIVTRYEMKTRRVTRGDIDRALQKIESSGARVDNYLFITTDVVDDEVQEYARSMYEKTYGIEMALLDCLSFLRHFLHLFHRHRTQYLEAYQELVLAEPISAVSQPLKEAFLALRQVAESGQ